MRYELTMASRYIFSRKRKCLFSFMSLISILGISVGVACLITVMAVMNGFSNELEKRIIGQNPHIIVERQNGISQQDYEPLMHDINSIPGIKGSYPFIWGQGVISFRKKAQGIMLRSVDMRNITDKDKIEEHIYAGSLELGQGNIIIGKELSMTLGAFIGDELDIIASGLSKPRRFHIIGIFHSGMYEYDLNLAYIGLDDASSVFSTDSRVNGIGIDLKSASRAPHIKDQLKGIIPYDSYARTWMELNQSLFSALKLEKLAMFIILTLIVIVAALNIISTITVMVTDKKKDIGILKAIGATGKAVMFIFSFQGIIIGFLGVAAGALGGIGLVYLLDKWRLPVLPESIYYGINYLPVRISAPDSFLVLIAALVISFLASVYPAYQASRLEPVDALRYE
jgi:lipoprotein-releasing system permease protein